MFLRCRYTNYKLAGLELSIPGVIRVTNTMKGQTPLLGEDDIIQHSIANSQFEAATQHQTILSITRFLPSQSVQRDQ